MTKFTKDQIQLIYEKIKIPKRWLDATEPTETTGELFKLVKKVLDRNYKGVVEEGEDRICGHIVDSINKGRLVPTKEEFRELEKNNERVYGVIKKSRKPGSELAKVVEKIDESSDEEMPTMGTNLEVPNNEKLQEGIKKIKERFWVEDKLILQIITNLCAGRHILLAGPIGTGKSELAKIIPKTFWNYKIQRETATYEWGAAEVVGGYRPREDGDGLEKVDGCVTKSVKESIELKKENGKGSGKWLIIDEFNRADIDKAMGELFSSLVDRRIRDKNGKEMEIPADYRIIGTLNTSDKHFLNKLSSALLRRFAYIEVNYPVNQNPETEFHYALKNALKKSEFSNKQFQKLFQLNENKVLFSKPMYDKLFKDAYNIFQFVREEKKLGTAIIEAMFQTMITRLLIRNEGEKVVNGTEALDYALVSNIIPQLWGANKIFLESLRALCTENLGVYFKRKFDEFRKTDEISAFPKYAKQLELFNKWYKNMKENKNYFPTIDKQEIDRITKNVNFEKMISEFSNGEKFDDEVAQNALKTVIQGAKVGTDELEFFKRALDDEIKKSDFND